ncbi:MAG: dihydrofolate reductase family protein, partial [Calditrichota bacterium]
VNSRIAKTLDLIRTILLTGAQFSPPGLELDGLEVLKIPLDKGGRLDPVAILQELPQRGILSVLIEGGAGVLSSFMQAGVVDEIFVGIAPTVIGQGLSPFADFAPKSWEERPRYHKKRIQGLGEDVIISYQREGDPFLPD